MRRKGPAAKPQRTTVPTPRPAPASAPGRGDYRLTPALVAIGLIVATLAAYGNLYDRNVEFFRLDDGDYVVENEHVAGVQKSPTGPRVGGGLTSENMAWAFTAYHAANWHPLTWLSLQLDYELYGLNPGGFHLTNVILHAAAAVLLLIVLERMTRQFWASAFVAALFALHPLRVESVAWISERKDVLGAFFWILTMGAYAWYAARPSVARHVVVTLCFALGLLAKPMLVTLPCALLLLDYWPLRRFGPAAPSTPSDPHVPRVPFTRLVIEKLPWLALSLAASIVTIQAQLGKKEPLLENLSMPLRLLNAALAYVGYLGQTFWPMNLAPLYSRPAEQFPVMEGVIALVALLVVTGVVLVLARQRPYLPVGWFWFLGTLVPVIGIVQVGVQTMADRYTYIPHIGLLVMIVWGLVDLIGQRVPRLVLSIGAAAALAACFLLTYRQAFLWQNNIALWEHTLQVTRNNFAAHDNLGVAMMGKARDLIDLAQPLAERGLTGQVQQLAADAQRLTAEAIPHFRTAVDIEPKYAMGYLHLGLALMQQDKLAEAVIQFKKVIALVPHHTEAYTQLANCYRRLGNWEQAIEPLRAVVKQEPDSATDRFNLGTLLLATGHVAEAERELLAAQRLDPRLNDVYPMLGLAASLLGKTGEARDHYQAATRRLGNWQQPMRREAWRLATDPEPRRRNALQALLWARMVSHAVENDAQVLDTLAAALAENGQFAEAVATAKAALNVVKDHKELETALRARLQLYEQRQPYREAAKPATK